MNEQEITKTNEELLREIKKLREEVASLHRTTRDARDRVRRAESDRQRESGYVSSFGSMG